MMKNGSAREHMLRIKMSEDEKRRFQSLAEERGLNFSTYVRMILEEKYSEKKQRNARRTMTGR